MVHFNKPSPTLLQTRQTYNDAVGIKVAIIDWMRIHIFISPYPLTLIPSL